MSDDTRIRETCADDEAALPALYSAAFRDLDLMPLVQRLLDVRSASAVSLAT